jgi:putative salt-induced outer membrane protein
MSLRRMRLPREMTTRAAAFAALLVFSSARVAGAQDAPPPKVWTTSAGAGVAVTSGNSDTSLFNANYSIAYDPQRKNIVKSEGLLIRGKSEGELSSDRLSLNVRDEYRFNTRAFVFAQNQYLRDTFKEIDYLIAPTAGLGYKIVDTDATKLSVDGGLGGVWERNPDADVRRSGAVTVDQRLSQRASATTTITQLFAGLWKTGDFGDALYQIGAGVAVAMSARTQLRVEWLNTYKNEPPTPDVEKNDMSLLIAFVFKN